ncbi:respiratory nitrate reductase subunit gamma [Ectothiorhodospira shaposhnikovii]|uniref:respiratory nitrate reductase subunit gamma n=1 Tax=Ectothiorhodospira shaposhnikovii TaxID=1054 RepID=UPI001EE80B93|nr:respiratory nitrate reductase subunit gamma [Ectothiorhodospira shaposhnikovii]MCG5511894.1 respiratory nitrate reductase subunit gamma [Ectothiorhodospira shaposhnikovii]
MNYMHELIFGYYPYVALSVFLLGSLIRFERDQFTWKSQSSQFLRTANMRLASNLFHVGILLLFFGHLFGLLTPPAVYHALGLSTETKQLLAIIVGGIFGIICFIGLTMLLHRRLTDPRIQATSSRADNFILILLYVQLILGLITLPISMTHLDGANMVALASWAQHIVTFQSGAAALIADTNWIFKLHIFLGLTLFLVFPFTRLVHVWSAPVSYLGRTYQLVRKR